MASMGTLTGILFFAFLILFISSPAEGVPLENLSEGAVPGAFDRSSVEFNPKFDALAKIAEKRSVKSLDLSDVESASEEPSPEPEPEPSG